MKEYIVKGRLENKTGFMSFTVKQELIRCKDCKNYYPNMEADGETGDCKKARWFRRLQYPNDYCSRAMRRGEEE